MSSTFFGLHIGTSALTAYNAAVNTTANNIANVQTTGYSRQETILESSEAIRINTRYGSTGTGVVATSITQQRDLYYDAKYWQNNANLGLNEEKLYYLDQIEDVFTDDSVQKGFSTIFNNMFNGLDTLKTNAADETVRNQFINQAQQLCTYFNSVSQSLTDTQETLNEEVKNAVDSINGMSEKLSVLNREINSIEINGGYANELRDERANILDALSKVVNIETIESKVTNSNGDAYLGGTHFTVIANGQILVDGNENRTLECVPRDQKRNQSDAEGLYDIVWSDSRSDFAEVTRTAGGSLKALFLVRDGNNNDNLKGTVSTFSNNSTLVIENPSISKINQLNIPTEGAVTIDGKEYRYTGWKATLDDEGNIKQFAFNLDAKSSISDGELAAMYGKELMNGKSLDAKGIVYYQNQINEFFRNFAELFNGIEQEGVTLDGEKMGAFFVGKTKTDVAYDFDEMGKTITSSSDSYYKLTAANAMVNSRSIRDSKYFATTASITNGTDAYEIVDKLKKLQSDQTIFRGDKGSAFLETLVSDISVDVDKTKTFYNNYSNLSQSIDKQRMSVSGVDEDDEAMNLIKFQNAYNMASKVISVLAEMYDKLINETGV